MADADEIPNEANPPEEDEGNSSAPVSNDTEQPEQSEESTPTDMDNTDAAPPNYIGGQTIQDYAPGMSDSQFITSLANPNPQQMLQHQIQVAQDVASGAIKPKTLNDYWNSKDTTGKIGTAFGLMLSSIGSGLTHQPNALLDFINKQIQNDFESQKENKTGAQNFLNNVYQHELNQAHEKLLTAQAAQIPITNEKIHAELGNIKADTQLKTLNNAMAYKKIQMLNDLDNVTQSLPPAQQTNAQQILNNQIKPPVIQSIIDGNNRTAAQLQFRQVLRGGLPGLGGAGFNQGQSQADQNQESPNQIPNQTTSNEPDSGVDITKLNNLVNKGKIGESLNIPVGLKQQELSEVNKEAKQVQDNRAVAKIYADSFQKLNNLSADKLQPAIRDAEVNSLGAQIARQTAGRYNSAEASAQANALFPDASDALQPGAREEKFRKAMQFFKAQEAATLTLDRYKLKTPFPNLSGNAPKEGDTGTANGKKVIFKNGAWRLQ